MATEEKKRADFARLFPKAVEALMDRLRILKQKSVKGSYAWDHDVVHDTWVQIGIIFCRTAESFGVTFELLVDGTEVQYIEPKKRTQKRRRAKK